MYKLGHGSLKEDSDIEPLGEFENAWDIRNAIDENLLKCKVDSKRLRLLGSGSGRVIIDYGNYSKFLIVDGVKKEFFSFVREFYSQEEKEMENFEFIVSLNSIERVKEFVDTTRKYPFEIDVVSTASKRYCVDAKSIMGLLSLDLSRSLRVVCHESASACEAFKKDVSAYVVE